MSFVLPASLSAAIEAVAGHRISKPEATKGGYSNLSFYAVLSGQDVVVKAAHSERKWVDLAREAQVLQAIAASSDESALAQRVPRLIAHGEVGEWAVNVVSFVAGMSTNDVFALPAGRGPRGGALAPLRDRAQKLTALMALAAPALRTVQSFSPPVTWPKSFDHSAECSTALAEFVASPDAGDISKTNRAEMLDALTVAARAPGLAFVHGDFGLHNLLWDSREGEAGATQLRPTQSRPTQLRHSATLDFEFSGYGSPMVDVAWLWWSLWFRGYAEVAWPQFVASFGVQALSGAGFEGELILALVRAQMIRLMSRTEPGTAARQTWLDRWDELPNFGLPTL